MARRHWRFVVRDQYGFVIQNAKVNVYQPGTTTNFVGNAYDAVTGGSAVTNPITTNAFGEAEAWFDTAQVVDVQVDDNSNLAYRAVGGASATVDFSTFTEKDDIYVSASDQQVIDFGEVGDIAAGIINPYTAVTGVAGASLEVADAAHVHPYTALTPAAAIKRSTVASAGTLLNPARSDHIHPYDAPAGKLAKFTTTSDTNEQVLHTYPIAANSMLAGSMFRVVLRAFQTNSTTAITWTFRVRWGGVAGVIVGNALALVGTTTAHTDNPVSLEFLMTLPTIGASGTATGVWSGSECITTAVANTPVLVKAVQTAAATIDTTAAKDLVITQQMNLTTGTPQLEVDDVLIEQVA